MARLILYVDRQQCERKKEFLAERRSGAEFFDEKCSLPLLKMLSQQSKRIQGAPSGQSVAVEGVGSALHAVWAWFRSSHKVDRGLWC